MSRTDAVKGEKNNGRRGVQASAIVSASEDSRAPARLPAASANKGGAKKVATDSVKANRRQGGPREADTVIISVRLAKDVLARIDDFVERSGGVYRDRSEFIRQTVAAATLAPQAVAVRQVRQFKPIGISLKDGRPIVDDDVYVHVTKADMKAVIERAKVRKQ